MRQRSLAAAFVGLCTQLFGIAEAQTAPAAAKCLLEGSSTRAKLRISPMGVAPFWIDVKDSALSARFDTGAPLGPAVVAGVLAIRGDAQLDTLALHTQDALTTDDDVLGVPAGHRLRDVAVMGAALRTAVHVGGVRATGFAAQCARSVVGWHAKDGTRKVNKSAQHSPDASVAEMVQPLDGRLSLRAHIDGAHDARVHVLEGGAVARFTLRVLARRGGFVRVERTFPDGSWLRGWTAANTVGSPKPRKLNIGHGYGIVGCGTCGLGFGQRRIKAELNLGAAIHAQPGVGPWATVLEPVQTTAILTDGQPWAMLEHLPSVHSKHIARCSSARTSRAFVHVEQLRVNQPRR